MTFVYDHPTSQHVDAATAAAPAPEQQASATPDQGQSEPLQFQYPSMQTETPPAAADVPANIAELRQADQARALYSPQVQYRDAIEDFDGEDEPVKVLRAEARNIYADMSLSGAEAREVTALFNSELSDGAPSSEKVAEWERQATEDMQRRYGSDFASRLADAKRLLGRDARVAAILRNTHLSSHPRVVAMLFDKALRERMAGRL